MITDLEGKWWDEDCWTGVAGVYPPLRTSMGLTARAGWQAGLLGLWYLATALQTGHLQLLPVVWYLRKIWKTKGEAY